MDSSVQGVQTVQSSLRPCPSMPVYATHESSKTPRLQNFNSEVTALDAFYWAVPRFQPRFLLCFPNPCQCMLNERVVCFVEKVRLRLFSCGSQGESRPVCPVEKPYSYPLFDLWDRNIRSPPPQKVKINCLFAPFPPPVWCQGQYLS